MVNNDDRTSNLTTLVTGGTGKTGRRIAQRLADRGIPVRIGSRSADIPFDWANEATWAPALREVEAVYVSYYPDLAVPGSVETVQRLMEIARESSARRVVLLSGRGEEEAEHAEEVVRASGIDWTIVRSSWFAQNFSESYMLEAILVGELALPAGAVREPFIDADDIAEVAVAALTEAGHAGKVYEVTGPRLLTFAEAVAEIAAATGRDIRYVQVTAEAFAAELAKAGVPDDYVWLLNYLFTTVLDGRNESLAAGVEQALGRQPKDFSTYVQETAASGVWDKVATTAR
jgi:uncharacterized protein YbjT (DUF2867 family)